MLYIEYKNNTTKWVQTIAPSSSMEIANVNFIHLLDEPRTVAKNATTVYRPSGRNQTCGPVIPVQRSNQLSCRGQQGRRSGSKSGGGGTLSARQRRVSYKEGPGN